MEASGQLCAHVVLSRGNSFWYVISTRLGGPPNTVWTLWWREKKSLTRARKWILPSSKEQPIIQTKIYWLHVCPKYVIEKLFVTVAKGISWKVYQMCDFIVKKQKILKVSGDKTQGSCRQCTNGHYVYIYLLTYLLHGAEFFLRS